MKNIKNKRDYMERFLRKEDNVKPPVGFWQHFVSFEEHHLGLADATVIPRVLAGQIAYIEKYKPDFIKVMSDGFFSHPSMEKMQINTVQDLDLIDSVGETHPWYTQQVQYVRTIREYVGPDCMLFYSIFSPLSYIRLRFEELEKDEKKFPRLFMEAPEKMLAAAECISSDVIHLIDLLSENHIVDGFFYSVQSLQDQRTDDYFHQKYLKKNDVTPLEHMKEKNAKILLHICGYGENINPLRRYADYPADIVNWATHAERCSLKEGKEIFRGKAVLGGFNNNPSSLIYTGSKEELKKELWRILEEAGTQGVAIGADCTLAASLEDWRIPYIQELVDEYAREHIQ